MIRGVLFDWDGVLAERVNFVPIWEHVERLYQVPQQKTRDALARSDKEYLSGKIDNPTFWRRITNELLIPYDISLLNNLFFVERKYNHDLLDRIKKTKGTYIAGVVSNNFDVVRERLVREFGDLFDGMFFSCETGNVKPSFEAFSFAAIKLGLQLDEVVCIDDDPKNIEMLTAKNVQCILYRWANQPLSYLYTELQKKGVNL